jgi:hypothetical protein
MWKYTNKHYIEYKVQCVEINFNTATEDASDDSKNSSLVSGLVWVSWSRLLIITNSFAEKTTRIFTGFWTLATSSSWSQSPPLCFLVTVVWFFSIRLTSTTLNRWRTESTFYTKSNKLLFLSKQLRHTLFDKQLSRFNKFLHALVVVDSLNSFRRLLNLGQLFRFHTWCKLFHSTTKKYQFLRMFLCFCRPIVGAVK